MRIKVLFGFLLISNLIYGQNTQQIDSEIFKALVCTTNTNKVKVEDICSLNIDRFEFYQDSVSKNQVYFLKKIYKNNDLAGACGADIVFPYYDKIPYETINQNYQIDTSELNQYLLIKRTNTDFKKWSDIIENCENVKFCSIFLINPLRYLFVSNHLVVGKPIILNNNKMALIKVFSLQIGYRIRIMDTNIYFLEHKDNVWIIREKFKLK